MAGFFARSNRAKVQQVESAAVQPIGSDTLRRVELLDSFENAGLGWFWATDAQGRLIYLSENAMNKLGCKAEEIIGTHLAKLFTHEVEEQGGQQPERPLNFLLGARNSITQYPVRLALGSSEMWWEIAGKPQFDDHQEFIGYRGSAKDISSSFQSRRDAERMAQYDSLTGLANRHRMNKRLDATLQAFRNSKRSCALLMLDLDRFKQVNDTLGHPAGDELLRQVAARLEKVVGDKGEIGRLGGDEFQVILPDMDDRGDLGELSQRIIQMISQPYQINGSRAIIGTSVGVAVAPYDGVESDELIKAADLALYAAKGGGRGQYRFFHIDFTDGAKHRRQIEEDLRDALENNELKMHYQPIVDAKTHMLKCLEALMRWEHPERGFIPPSQFIPVAEDIGMIKHLGEWALLATCKQAKEWPVELRVAVNVSPIQFARDDFPALVKSVLLESGLEPHRLELEITESVFVGDAERTQSMFEELKRIGVRLALDDFGTGYSSLSYLQKAPFDKIKIDQSFVRGATEKGNNNPAIMSAIVSLAESLGMETVAEGVETKDELNLVTERGASHVQGFIFSQAIPHEELLERLEKGELRYEPRGPERFRADRKSVYRKISLFHDDHKYNVTLRNLSKTGAMIEGLLNVPLDTKVVLNLGGGQLAVATVRRSDSHMQGLEFETPLISDGADGLCTRHRVSPYQIEAAGKPLEKLPDDPYEMLMAELRATGRGKSFLEVDLSANRRQM
ncbi:putative bifunctional diguanylate cyclase/phosphodiesterase [Qipengyuania soli]|uniref:EAL domain-containing protein n=1 Tax=Qipengyuania soli TaxID=2782568 RepID=A0A7S8IW18_9SPHN|nr:EAL domain-containing protein [Qipengyuania soli]QPD00216.1 EAL domain-containing protein [Qipengyuania soli]